MGVCQLGSMLYQRSLAIKSYDNHNEFPEDIYDSVLHTDAPTTYSPQICYVAWSNHSAFQDSVLSSITSDAMPFLSLLLRRRHTQLVPPSLSSVTPNPRIHFCREMPKSSANKLDSADSSAFRGTAVRFGLTLTLGSVKVD